MTLSRRSFLVGGAVALAGASGWRALSAPPIRQAAHRGSFGPLVPDPAAILDLPEGFRYHIVERSGEPMSDGYVAPVLPDGMGCFTLADGKLALMRNHEIWDTSGGPYAGSPPREAYSRDHVAGVTRVVLDPKSFERVSSNLVLAGTSRNCAGGVSPWGWLSCEETSEPGHGYVFLCSTEAGRVAPPRKLPGYGRFFHEAAALDPSTRVAYLTEDAADGAFYRFLPTSADAPFEGKLQALRVRGKPRFDTSGLMRVGDRVEVDWVGVPNPDPSNDDESVRAQAHAAGAALVMRGEGVTFGAGAVTFCATTGGPVGAGQVFRLEPEGDGGVLWLLAQSEDTAVLHCPDNVTVAPWGETYVCEDPFGRPSIRGITDAGEVFQFARNAKSWGEFAGVCFSPDGRAMFMNLQHDGLTLAITGPFPASAG